MTILQGVTADRIAEHFISYLFNDYNGSGHIRRVAAWVGFIIRGIERAAGNTWWIGGGSEMRQLWFTYADRTFKIKYVHSLGRTASQTGGLAIIEVAPT